MTYQIEISSIAAAAAIRIAADELVVNILRNSLESIRMDVDRLMHQPSLTEFEKEDLAYALVMRTHMQEVLKYYLPNDQWASI